MIFLLNCFITNQRPSSLNRYDRYQIFKYMLHSYRNLPFTDIYIFIKLDTEYNHLQNETQDYIYKTFHNIDKNKIHVIFDRYTRQEQWASFITNLYEKNPNELVWLSNNDDHIFIDVNTDLINEGVELLKKEQNPYASIYLSHFPEIIKHSLLFNPIRVGNYVKSNLSLFDSIQIFSMKLLYFIFVEHKWRTEHKRIDSILNEVASIPALTNEIKQVIYIPLREICRKFNGYDHVSLDINIFPPLHLPKNTFYYSAKDVETRMNAPHTGWSTIFNNNNEIPREWVNASIALYKGYNEHTVSFPEHYKDVINKYDMITNSNYLTLDTFFSFY